MIYEEKVEEGHRGIVAPTATSSALVLYLASASNPDQIPALISTTNIPAAPATIASASSTPPRFDDQYLHPPESPTTKQMNFSQGQ